MVTKWFVIVNPTSGNGSSKKKWPKIKTTLENQNFDFIYKFSEYEKHTITIIQTAIIENFTHFICVGGDGTIHETVNAILLSNPSNLSQIIIGIIPIGTGNDWVKNYQISKNYKEAIKIIKSEHSVYQDIGKIELLDINKVVYFNNLAGIGFDAFIVHKVAKYKHFGALAYLLGALTSLTSFIKPEVEIEFNNLIFKQPTLLALIGICKYAGGGMQLTNNPNTTDQLFDISIVYKVDLFTILKNLLNLFNGKITSKSFVHCYKTNSIKINILNKQNTYIQADGELLETSNFKISSLSNTIKFIVPKNKL